MSLCLAASTLGSGLVGPAQAQPIGAQISPVAVEKEMRPGEITTVTLSVFNPFQYQQTMDIFAMDFFPQDAQGGLGFVEYSNPQFSLSRWLDFPKEIPSLNPQGEAKISVEIAIPPNALAGSHFAAVFTSPRVKGGPDSSAQYQIRQRVAVGSIFLIKVLGETGLPDPYAGEAGDLELNSRFQLGGYPILTEAPSFKMTFKNTGLFHQIVWGGLEIYNPWGKRQYSKHLPEHRVLPKASSLFQEKWSGPRWLGVYTAKTTLLFGAEGQNQTTRERRFVYINPPALLALSLGLALAVFLRQRRRRTPTTSPESRNHET